MQSWAFRCSRSCRASMRNFWPILQTAFIRWAFRIHGSHSRKIPWCSRQISRMLAPSFWMTSPNWQTKRLPGLSNASASQRRRREKPATFARSNSLSWSNKHSMALTPLARLKFGVTAWNAWRREHPDLAINLDGANLNGMILTRIDFSRVSLRGASLHATNLMNADLRQADLTAANLAEADLIAARLEGAILTGANLHEADLRDADLTNAQYSVDDLKGALHLPG